MSRYDVTYVLAACGAPRHHEWGPQKTDRLCYVRRHLDLLRHEADQYARIVVVNSGADPGLSAVARAWPAVEVLERPNDGMSYGAFHAAIAAYPSDYYVLMEDDYVLVPGATEALVEYLQTHPRCGFYAGGVTDHVAIFAGVVRREATTHWLTQSVHGGKEYGIAGYRNQIEVSRMLEHDGWELHDWLDRWASAFWISGDRCVRWYSRAPSEGTRLCAASYEGDLTRVSLLLPLQALDGPVRVSDGRRWHTATLGLDGRLTPC